MLTKIAENLFIAEDTFLAPGRVHMPVRMTVVVLASGALVLHSPIAIDDALAAELETLGKPAFIIAPNCLHHLFAGDALSRWPDAKLYACPGLAEKRPDLAIHETLGDQAPAVWRDEIDQVVVLGLPKLNEVLFFHKTSRTLIVTDLVLNVQHAKNWMTALFFRVGGSYKKLAQCRLWRMLTKDRAASAQSVAPIFDWPIERVIMAHGEILEKDAKARLQASVRNMMAA